METQDKNWRDAAINEALRIEADGGDSEDMLLREIRRTRPGCATAMLWIDREQLPRFLQGNQRQLAQCAQRQRSTSV
jgi:hypothetical protein